MPSKPTSHDIDEKGRALIHTGIANTSDGVALLRELTGRDYGVDGLIELFKDGYATGEFALIQIKSTEKSISIQKRKACVAIDITASCARYAIQTRIPFLLLYCSVKDKITYYRVLNGTITEREKKKIDGNKSVRISIPAEAKLETDFRDLIRVIEDYYKGA